MMRAFSLVLTLFLTVNFVLAQNKSQVIDHKLFTLADYYKPNPVLDLLVDSIYNGYTWRQRLAQKIMTSVNEPGKSLKQALELVEGQKVGGVIFFKDSVNNTKKYIEQLNAQAKKSGCPPLFMAIDAEPNLFKNRLLGSKPLSNHKTSDLKSEKATAEVAKQIADQLKQIGLNVNFAPVSDNGGNKEIISSRSFGTNADVLVNFSGAFIKATQSEGVVACSKHFPGHGLVTGDSHKNLVYIDGEAKEVPVFKKIIEQHNPTMIMVGHIAIKNNQQLNTNNLPATLDEQINIKLLRDSLGYKGVTITDAMNMGAVASIKNGSLLSAISGIDIVLMPADEAALHWQMLGEMSANKKIERQFEESIKRIIRLKICLGIIGAH